VNRFYRIVHTILRPLIWLFFPWRLKGLEHIPEGGAVLCANHASCWDPVLIGLALPRDIRLAIMAKDELFHIPVLGFLIRKLGAFPVRRGASDLTAMKTAMRALQNGQRLLVFPEGTRANQGDTEAKGGVTLMATRTGVPMVPIYCGGRHKAFRRTTIAIGEPYWPEIAGRRPTSEENQAAASEILTRIYALREVDGWK